MKTFRTFVLAGVACLSLSGCTGVTAVSAALGMVPGFVVEGIFKQAQGGEKSMPVSMREGLALSQSSLRDMGFDADIIEPTEKECFIAFSKQKINGAIHMVKKTERLTTFEVSVRDGVTRDASVEEALFAELNKKITPGELSKDFDTTGYRQVRTGPDDSSAPLGLVKDGAEIEVVGLSKNNDGWVKVKMPSSKLGWFNGSVVKK